MRIISRGFEPGFLSTSCADPALSPAAVAAASAPTEGVSTSRIGLGSVPLQTADLSTVSCDYIFQEPVLLYSHSNGYKFPTFLEDSMNIMSILMALDISRNVRVSISFHVFPAQVDSKFIESMLISFSFLYYFLFLSGHHSVQYGWSCSGWQN